MNKNLSLPILSLLIISSGIFILSSLHIPSTNQTAAVSDFDGNLVLHYTFDDGTATDSSGRGNNGTVNGATPVAGKIGQALHFNGAGDHITIAANSSLNNLGPVTYSAWVNPVSVSGSGSVRSLVFGKTRRIFHLSDVAAPGHPVVPRMFISSASTNAQPYCADKTVPLNQWSHIAVVWDGTLPFTGTFYVNGEPCTTSTTNLGSGSVSDDTSNSAGVGAASDGSYPFDGSIDDVRVYNTTLSAIDIQNIYSAGLGSNSTPPPSDTGGSSGQTPQPQTTQDPTGPSVQGNIVTAHSCEYADVFAAIQLATAGNTVHIPAGTCTWSSALTLSKSITLEGAGDEATHIMTAGSNGLVIISLPADVPLRVTGMYLDMLSNLSGTPSAIFVQGKRDGSFGVTKIRIDHNIFNKGTRQVYVSGWAYGVVDHNHFINGNISVHMTGDNTYAWNRPIQAGTGDALFVEDNLFTINNAVDREPNDLIYHQEGGRTVIRYNTFDGTTYTNGSSVFFDTHGNWGNPIITTYRGQPIIEVYNNTFKAYKAYDMLHFRGGSVIIHDNSLSTIAGGKPNIFRLEEEEAWTVGGPWCPSCPLDSTWPGQDQVNNSFFWNNTYNGQPITDIHISSPEEQTFFKKDRDYFMHPPEASGGREVYPTTSGGNDMIFNPSGPNAYYPYTPYVYPHPLVSGTTPPPTPPYTPPPVTPSSTADFNHDGKVNSLDFSLLQGSWNQSSSTYDLNHDGTVNTLDYSLLIQQWTG